MGEFTNIIVFFMIFAFLTFMFSTYSGSDTVTGADWTQTLKDKIVGSMNFEIGALTIGVVAIAASIMFPNPYTLFAGVTGLFLSLISIVGSVLNEFGGTYGLDSTVIVFLNAIFSVIMTFTLIGWYRGDRPI